MKPIRSAFAAIGRVFDRRDLLGACGVALLYFGGERLYPGAGLAASGAVLVAVAVWVR